MVDRFGCGRPAGSLAAGVKLLVENRTPVGVLGARIVLGGGVFGWFMRPDGPDVRWWELVRSRTLNLGLAQ